MSQSIESHFGYGIFLSSPETDSAYYSRFTEIIKFLGVKGIPDHEYYDDIENDQTLIGVLKDIGLSLEPQYSYEYKAYCLIVTRSHIISYEDPEVLSVNHVENRSGFDVMDRLAEYLGMNADYMIWWFVHE
jgi:hypothetical protein